MLGERTRLLLQCVLVLLLIKAISSRHQQQLRRVCYFTNWSCDLLVKEAYFCLQDLDAGLCSHIIFAFAGVNVTSLNLSPIRLDDESVGNVKGRYVQFNDIKKTNPGVKTLLSAGGSYQAEKFKLVTSTNTSRARFAYNTARYVRQWGFDGLDLDWEYPGKLEKDALTYLVKDLKSAFREEALRTGQPELLLSIAVPVGEERVRLGYQVDLISKDADMINLMAYDFYYGAWTVTAFNSPLYPRNHHRFSRKHSVEWIVNLWINLGAPPHKINLGIAGYGQSFTLQVDPGETLATEVQTTNNGTGAGLDQKSQNTTAGLRNIVTVNDTLYNNVTDSVKGHIQPLLSIHDSVQKTIPLCNGHVDGCVMESPLFQNSRRKRDSHGSFSQDISATSPTSDVRITSTNNNPAGFKGRNTDEISIHENGIGSQELDSQDNARLRADREMLSHDEFPTYRNGHGNHRHADSSPSVGSSHWQRDRNTDVYGGNSRPPHSTDGVVYGGSSRPPHSTDDVVYGGNSRPPHSTDGGVYGRNSRPPHSTDGGVYGVGSKAVGPGRPGRLRHLKGQLSYPEICERIHAGAEVAWDQEQRVPYAFLGDQWVGYENPRSVAEKVTWAFEHHLGGVMFWSLDLDDFKGSYCGQGRFPLLTSMSTTVLSLASQRNKGVNGNTRHFTNQTSLTESTDAAAAQESRATPVFGNNIGNATERPITTVALVKNQHTTSHQIVTATPRLSGQHVYEHDLVHSVTSVQHTTHTPSEIGPTDVSRVTSRHQVGLLTPVQTRHPNQRTTTQLAENAGQRPNRHDHVTSTSRFQPHGKKQAQPTDLFPSKERKQSEPTDFYPSNESQQSKPTDLFPPNDRKQSKPTDSLPPNERKQSEPTDFLPSNDRKQSKPTDSPPPNDRKQSEPTHFLPPNDKKQSEPTHFLPPNDSKQSKPTDSLPHNDRKQSKPTDFLPPNDSKQSEPTNLLLSNETKQSEPSPSVPSAGSKQSAPTDSLTPDGKAESEISNNDDDYTPDALPTATITAAATTTTHTIKSNKPRKSHSKPKTKKRYLYRNTSSSLAASIRAVVYIICVVFSTIVYS